MSRTDASDDDPITPLCLIYPSSAQSGPSHNQESRRHTSSFRCRATGTNLRTYSLEPHEASPSRVRNNPTESQTRQPARKPGAARQMKPVGSGSMVRACEGRRAIYAAGVGPGHDLDPNVSRMEAQESAQLSQAPPTPPEDANMEGMLEQEQEVAQRRKDVLPVDEVDKDADGGVILDVDREDETQATTYPTPVFRTCDHEMDPNEPCFFCTACDECVEDMLNSSPSAGKLDLMRLVTKIYKIFG